MGRSGSAVVRTTDAKGNGLQLKEGHLGRIAGPGVTCLNLYFNKTTLVAVRNIAQLKKKKRKQPNP